MIYQSRDDVLKYLYYVRKRVFADRRIPYADKEDVIQHILITLFKINKQINTSYISKVIMSKTMQYLTSRIPTCELNEYTQPELWEASNLRHELLFKELMKHEEAQQLLIIFSHSMAEAARLLGISRPTVYKYRDELIERLRAKLNKGDTDVV